MAASVDFFHFCTHFFKNPVQYLPYFWTQRTLNQLLVFVLLFIPPVLPLKFWPPDPYHQLPLSPQLFQLVLLML